MFRPYRTRSGEYRNAVEALHIHWSQFHEEELEELQEKILQLRPDPVPVDCV